MNEKVLRYWISALPEVILWVVLLFTFKYDFLSEDFVSLNTLTIFCLAGQAGIMLRRIILQTIIKRNK